jgi:hypothetical protein
VRAGTVWVGSCSVLLTASSNVRPAEGGRAGGAGRSSDQVYLTYSQ